ncbi:MAG: glycosyltransferase family 4 protein [Magnetospirillum sp.]|nr:glycosyltransferase family 4 protein [Magnetospirillum sp.]
MSTTVTGGTETALFALLESLRDTQPEQPLLVIGLKRHIHELDPLLGSKVERLVWPATYSWFVSDEAREKRYSPAFQRVAAALGPLSRRVMPAIHRRFFERPLSARAAAWARRGFGLNYAVSLGWRLYAGLRYGNATLSRAAADRLLRHRGVSVVHFPYPHHFDSSVPFVYEPWGLPHIHQPEMFSPAEAEWMDRLFRHGCQTAAMVVTATRWVKNDIVQRYGIDPAKVAVIPRRPPVFTGNVDGVDLPAGVPAEFALFPSVTWPTKNHIRLLRAVALLRDQKNLRVNLVCTGRTKTANWPDIKAEWERLGLQDQVLFTGSIPLEQLVALFKKAKYLVHPSTFEGLGLPLIEAFQYGLPVLSSTSACKPEVVGDAAILFDALDEADIARAMAEAEQSPERLRDLAEAGRRRLVEAFPNPEKMARMFMAVYRHAAGWSLDADQAALLDEMLT